MRANLYGQLWLAVNAALKRRGASQALLGELDCLWIDGFTGRRKLYPTADNAAEVLLARRFRIVLRDGHFIVTSGYPHED